MQESVLIVGIDVGGTNTRVVLARQDNPSDILAREVAPTPAHQGIDAFLGTVSTLIERCMARVTGPARLVAIGCCTPGIVDADEGIVHLAVNLGWKDLRLAEALSNRFGMPAVIENDVKSAAVAEHGLHPDARSLVYFTVSTGVSAGIVVNGKVLRGGHHAAGELAFLLPERKHVGQDLQGLGCLEILAGGVGLSREWEKLQNGESASAADIFEAAAAGNVDARELVERAADYLAQAAVAIGALIDPDLLVLGGSIAEHQPLVSNRIRQVTERTLPFPPQVVPASLGGDAPIAGALLLASRLEVGATNRGPVVSA